MYGFRQTAISEVRFVLGCTPCENSETELDAMPHLFSSLSDFYRHPFLVVAEKYFELFQVACFTENNSFFAK